MTNQISMSGHPDINKIQTAPSRLYPGRIGIYTKNLYEVKNISNRDYIFQSQGDGLAIIGEDQDGIKRACDCCFRTFYKTSEGVQIDTSFEPKAEVHTTSQISTSQQSTGDSDPKEAAAPQEKLQACQKCRMVYYCNQTCKQKAWLHHHERECKILTSGRAKYEIRQAEGEGSVDDDDIDSQATCHAEDYNDTNHFENEYNIFDNIVRMAIRFLLVFKAHDSAALDLNTKNGRSLDHLLTNLSQEPGFPVLESCYLAITVVVRDLTGTSLSLTNVGLFVRMLYESRRALVLPILKDPCQPPYIGHLISPGYFVDPLLSLTQHSCDPNSHAIIQHGTIYVQALRDIPAGGEVTVSYVSGHESFDFVTRTRALHDFWNIRCACNVCKFGALVPANEHPEFHNMVQHSSVHTIDMPIKDHDLDRKVEEWLERLSRLGCGAGKIQLPVFRRLWYLRMGKFYDQKDYQQTLAGCLALYIWLERKDTHGERIDSLYIICDMLELRSCIRRTALEGWSQIPADVRREFPRLYFCMRTHYNVLLFRYFGRSAPITQREAVSWEEYQDANPKMALIRRELFTDSAKFANEMRKAINVLLNWVGHPDLDQGMLNELFGWQHRMPDKLGADA
ncbi:uncharacterized protein RAG0_05136 [Rhynchosporium agropyri]|uniref:Uncharacterized protein n=1 Tax=Rhynchosporium agropyri TaxID=914238 RepID=A0A1E1KBU2_9HELO|nr:uncharacterized protein RAG0_05136 [Rhynchosporium agropyri]